MDFEKISGFFYYLLDVIKTPRLSVNIEKFDFKENDLAFFVFYRYRGSRAINKMSIKSFWSEMFDKISAHDQYLTTKFLTFQTILDSFPNKSSIDKSELLKLIQRELSNARKF